MKDEFTIREFTAQKITGGVAIDTATPDAQYASAWLTHEEIANLIEWLQK